MTNGERIRSMSDEELVDIWETVPRKYCTDTPVEKCIFDCRKCFIRWLKQEAK